MRFCDLADILTRVIGDEAAAKACEAICREASGETIYIPARPGAPQVLPTETPREIATRYQVTVRTARNWVSRWK
jgi:hypothetical protein